MNLGGKSANSQSPSFLFFCLSIRSFAKEKGNQAIDNLSQKKKKKESQIGM